MDQSRAPLFEAVINHIERGTSSFHVPGHKSGKGFAAEAECYFKAIGAVDLTEIADLDDLHEPSGAIRDAEHLAAQCFGADRTFFLVGGSTAGNLAMILSVCHRGDLILVQRNVHKSVIHGLMLAGARAAFINPTWDELTQTAGSVSYEAVHAALEAYPEAKGILLTNPTYYGVSTDLTQIVSCAHRKNIPVLVDEAHGAHFGFHPEIPKSAMHCGADAAVQSAHKMLPAMTMGAMLHVQGNLVDSKKVKRLLGLLQSSSPSYPIMVSLDLSRRWLHTEGPACFERVTDLIRGFEYKIKQTMPWFQVSDRRIGAIETKDPLKLIIRDNTGTLSGFALKTHLDNLGCMAEMADEHNALLVLSAATDDADMDRLYETLQYISVQYELKKQEIRPRKANIHQILNVPLVSSPIEFGLHGQPGNLGQADDESVVPLCEAEGLRAAEMIIPYPPGIPLLFPGEIITGTSIAALQNLHSLGAKFQGITDPTFQTIRVKAAGVGAESTLI